MFSGFFLIKSAVSAKNWHVMAENSFRSNKTVSDWIAISLGLMSISLLLWRYFLYFSFYYERQFSRLRENQKTFLEGFLTK